MNTKRKAVVLLSGGIDSSTTLYIAGKMGFDLYALSFRYGQRHKAELQAAEKLFQAAKILAQEPQAIQLRYLETLTVIGADKNTTILFPLPMDLLTPFLERQK